MAEYHSDAKHEALRLETLLIHGGQAPEPVTGAVMPPSARANTIDDGGTRQKSLSGIAPIMSSIRIDTSY